MYEPEIVTISPITVIGPVVRTNNKIEATADGVITKLHEAFIKNHMSDAIDEKLDDHIISLYTEYDSGESGDYTYCIGHQVKDPEDMPKDCEIFDIPGGRYLRYPTERGLLHEVLPQAWQDIWRKTQAGTLGAERAYQTDFEFHNGDDELLDAQVDIYLSIKE